MALLIDGYNLLYASGIFGSSSRAGRADWNGRETRMLNLLAESLPADELRRTAVVFDASEAPYGLSRTFDHKGLTVHFASRDSDADSMIEELILQDSARTANGRLQRSSAAKGGASPQGHGRR